MQAHQVNFNFKQEPWEMWGLTTHNVEEQIGQDELLAKSLSYDASTSGKLPFKFI